MIRILSLVAFGILLLSCGEKRPNKFSDETIATIAELQDRRDSKVLYKFFTNENPAYRKEAVLAVASVQDTSLVKMVAQVLDGDDDENVRAAAAYALALAPCGRSYRALLAAYEKEKDPMVLREVIEALGKMASGDNALKVPLMDTKVPEGMAWAFYRIAIRGHADSTFVEKAISFLDPSNSEETRIGAAQFFFRSAKISAAETVLHKSATEDQSPYVRMATTLALKKIKTPATLETLKKILSTDKDYRVRICAVRSLQGFPLKDTKQNLSAALADSNPNVAIAVSEVIKSIATPDDFADLVSSARAAKNWRVQGNFYEAALVVSNNKETFEEVTKLYATTENPYAKAALLSALGKSTMAYNFVNEQLQSNVPVIRSTAASALVDINNHKEFTPAMQKDFAVMYPKAFETGDPAVIGTIADALADEKLGYKGVITDTAFLYAAKKKLSLPKDNEALQPLEKAITLFEGRIVPRKIKNEFNHPIDWSFVKTIPAKQKALIKTAKGDITIQLLVEEAPGSVANFVQLVNSHYFDSKNFHRVVPNFVVQGGCNRGDGWGSEDYSIRSEISMRRYAEGSIGMASAGKDTEGTQWFITHSPTPHLDGGYTIFAIVTEGMDVVHQMEVGDQILKVELIK